MEHIDIFRDTMIAAGAIAPNRFVTYAGGQAALGEKAYGVTQFGADQAGASTEVLVLGIATIETGGAFAAGDPLASDAEGKAIEAVAASTHFINAIAREASTAAGQKVSVFIVAAVAQA